MKTHKPLKIVIMAKRIFNIRQWSDYDRLKSFTKFLGAGIKKMVIPQKEKIADTKKTFTEASLSMKLTDQDLVERRKGLYRLSVLMSCVAFAIIAYGVFLLVYGHYRAFVISLVVGSIGFVLAFRYHFWYFQIKERRLGCTFKEWLWEGLLGRKP